VGDTPYVFLKARAKLLLEVMPNRMMISLIERKVVLSKISAARNRTDFKYWLNAVPVSCLKR
jgi:hypothetical protein